MRKRNLPDSFFTPPTATSSTSQSRESLDAEQIGFTTKASENIGQFHVKTRSEPASFAPQPNKISLQPFSQLQQNLLHQQKLKSSEQCNSANNQYVIQEQMFQGIQSGVFPAQPAIVGQTWIPFQLNQQVNVVQMNPMIDSNYSANFYQPNPVQELEKERENMRKRQLELQQINLIGSRNSSANQYRSLSSLYPRNEEPFQYNPQPCRQESLDSGLDLATCYSSSNESSGQVSHYQSLGNNSHSVIQAKSDNEIKKEVPTPVITEPTVAKCTLGYNESKKMNSTDDSSGQSVVKWRAKSNGEYVPYVDTALLEIYDSMSADNSGIEPILPSNTGGNESFITFYDQPILDSMPTFTTDQSDFITF